MANTYSNYDEYLQDAYEQQTDKYNKEYERTQNAAEQ